MSGLGSSPRLSSSAGDVERVVKTERDELRSSSIAMSSSPQRSPPPPAQTVSHATRPLVHAPPASSNENARQRTQEKDTSTDKRAPRLMGISELTEGRFTRFETQTEIVLPLQEHATREDSVRKDLTSRLLLLLLETHAWLASRPMHERMNEIEKLEEEVKHFSEIEEQQERAREKLTQFVRHFTSAIQALAQGMSF